MCACAFDVKAIHLSLPWLACKLSASLERRYMQPLKFFITFVIALLATPAIAQDSSAHPEVERFVRAVRMVDMFKVRASNYLRLTKSPTTEEAKAIRAFMNRVLILPHEDLMPAMVGVLSKISPADALLAAEALETPIGRKIIEVTLKASEFYEGDMAAARDSNPFSEEERSAATKLGSSPGWHAYVRITEVKIPDIQFAESFLALPQFADLRSK